MRKLIEISFAVIVAGCAACGGDNDGNISSETPTPTPTMGVTPAPDSGSSSATFTQGLAETVVENLFPEGVRVASVGEIVDESGITRTVPADVRYEDTTMPFASDLYNRYVDTHNYASAELAFAALEETAIVEVDAGGELVTAYVFADNYFELYVNGVAAGKDPVPFTDFNSNIVQFRVNTPFVVSALLVDWEESLGTGTESNGGNAYHPGDAGVVMVFKNSVGETIGVTDSNWKAQTFYTAPLTDRTCLSESGSIRSSDSCSTLAPSSSDSISAAHWDIPDTWMSETYDDNSWPNASTFENDTVGVNNKVSYTNFTDIFDDAKNDAQFIWSTNLVLDNTVIVRARIDF